MHRVGLLYGMEIVISNSITKEVRARKHKKRRIDKKWLKKYGYKHMPDNNTILHVGNTLYMTKKCYDKIKNEYEVKEFEDAE
jgi:hypothetical protein